MVLKQVWLRDFRNHSDFKLELDSKTTVVVGANGSGKTNLMEGIYLLATGKSFRADRIEQMVRWRREVGRVKGEIQDSGFKNQESKESRLIELEVVVTSGEVQGKKVPRKSLIVNGVRRQLRKFVGNLRVVMFGPDDMRLIEGSPSRRRGFMDEVLSQVYPDYRRALLSYEKGIRRRNKVLLALREGIGSRSQLFFWDRLLIKEGQVITKYRGELMEFMNSWIPLSSETSQSFRSQRDDKADLKSLSALSIMGEHTIEYDRSVISEQRLKQYEREEVAAGVTLVGPHRDDFVVNYQLPPVPSSTGQAITNYQITGRVINGGEIITDNRQLKTVNLAIYGSRGEQRMAVLWLKLGQLAFIERVTGEKPVLLLDDIFSELDHGHREIVMGVATTQQTIVTSADEHLVEGLEGKVVSL